ncbi:hypothetical protein FACS1894201_03490 [Bacteroidia bacterium]|nr:hypothetical protein FACS1894201_03490 [Bacteroidia bacterium]
MLMIGLLISPFVTFSQANSSSSWEKARDSANAMFFKIEQEKRYTDELRVADLNYLPIGLSKTISNVNYAVAIVEYVDMDGYMSITAYARVVIPQKDANGQDLTLFFAAQDIRMSIDGGIVGDGTLALLGNITIPMLGNRADLVLKGDFNMQKGTTTTKTYLSMDCKGFKELSIDADLVFPESFIKKANCDTSVDRSCQVSVPLRFVASDWNDMLVRLSLPPFEVVGLSDFIFTAQNAILDLSDIRNDATTVFPQDYLTNYSVPNYPTLWRGVYIQHFAVALPPQFKVKNSNERISFTADDLLLDEFGVTGLLSANDVLPLSAGSAGGWGFSVSRFMVRMEANELTGGGFGGQIGLPLGDSAAVNYDAYITAQNEYRIVVRPSDTLPFDAFCAKVSLYPNSYITLALQDGEFVPEAMLSGTMNIALNSIAGGADNSEGAPPATSATSATSQAAKFQGIRFEELRLRTTTPRISVKAMGYEGRLQVVNFPISVSGIGMRTEDDDAILYVNAGMELGQSGSGFSMGGSTSIGIVCGMEERDGSLRWRYKKTKMSDITISSQIAGICSINGSLSIKQQDPIYGDGFQGSIGMRFDKMLEGLSVDMRAIFGRKSYNYWLVDGLLGIPGGIPIFTGVSLTGFGGGVSLRMRPEGESSRMPTKAHYVPDSLNGLGIQAAVLIQAGNGAINGEAKFEVGFNNNGGVMYAGLFGQASFMGNIPGAEDMSKFVSDKFKAAAAAEQRFIGNDPQKKDMLQQLRMYEPNESTAAAYEPSQTPGQSGFLATMGLKYDFENNVFHGNFAAYANMANGMIVGSGANNRAGEVVLHIEQGQWYLHAGRPDNRIGLKLGIANVATLQVGSYFMVGDDMPPPAAVPSEVLSILGQQGLQVKDNRNLASLQSGRGIAFGTDFSLNTGDITAWIVYARLKAGIGFDVMLTDYGNATCSGSQNALGMNGWYANGQAYTYLQGEVGVKVNLFAIRKTIPILSGGAAALLQAQLPNPTWIAGTLAMNFNVLNGLIKGRVNLQVEFGEQCQIEMAPSNPLGIEVISNLTPIAESEDVDVFVAPQVAFNMEVNTPFNIEEDGERKTYRIRVSEFAVYDQTSAITGTIRYNADNLLATFEPRDVLPSQRPLTAKVKVVFEEYKNGTWSVQADEGKILEEHKEVAFRTGTAPDYIPTHNIAFCYPVIDQRFFYTNETSQGVVQLKRGQAYLLSDPSMRYDITFKDARNNEHHTAMVYDTVACKLTFTIPSLSAQSQYRMQVTSYSAHSGVQDQDLTKRVEVEQNATGSATVRATQAGTMIRDDMGSPLLAYAFGTSMYASFADKINNLPKYRQSYYILSMESVQLQYALHDAEGFDIVELLGSEYTGGQPLIHVSAKTDNAYFTNRINPLLYAQYATNASLQIGRRDVSLYGAPPLRAVVVHHAYIRQLQEGNFNDYTKTFFPFVYNVGKIYEDDFYELRAQAANMYVDNNTNDYVRTLANSMFPLMPYGTYNTTMNYILPDNTAGSSADFSYLYTATN